MATTRTPQIPPDISRATTVEPQTWLAQTATQKPQRVLAVNTCTGTPPQRSVIGPQVQDKKPEKLSQPSF